MQLNNPLKQNEITKNIRVYLISLVVFFVSYVLLLSFHITYDYDERSIFGLVNYFLSFLIGFFILIYIGNTFETETESMKAGSKCFKLKKEFCQKVFDLSKKHVEIKNYIVEVNKEGRQLYGYEYENFIKFDNYKKKEIENERKRVYCHRLYNEISEES